MKRCFFILMMLMAVGSALAQDVYRHHAQVKVFPETRARLQELYRYSNLDVVSGETAMEPQVIALPEDLSFLSAHGYRYEVVYPDVEQFYASRLTNNPETLMGGYKTYAEILTELHTIHVQHPTITTDTFRIGTTYEGRGLICIKISDNPEVDENEPEVFYNALIHAREPEGMEAEFNFMHYLTDNYGTNADVTDIVNTRELFFLPCVNPDGYEYNRQTNPNGGGQWRKNRHPNGDGTYGTDLNRNFDAAWGYDNIGSTGIPSDITYRGSAPFSELETQAIRTFVNSRHFVTEEDCHTYSNLLLIPWGTSSWEGHGITRDDATFRMMIDSMQTYIRQVNNVTYTKGTPWEILYNTNGGSFDWEYGAQNEHLKIFAMSTEIGGNSDGFWPPTNRITPLALENRPAFMFLARVAGRLAPPNYRLSYLNTCQSEIGGNSNGICDPGETVGLSVTLQNVGIQSIAGLTGTLSTSDPYATVTMGSATWSALNSVQTGNNSSVFQIAIAANCPTPRTINLSLHAVSSGQVDTTITVPLSVGHTMLTDNVESGQGNWTTTGNGSMWHISTRRSNSSSHAWFSGNETGTYTYPTDGWLVLPVVLGTGGAQIAYDQWYDLSSGYDYGYVELNTPSGWTRIGTAVTGQSGGWVHVAQTLNVTCPSTATQIRFRMSTDQVTSANEGWYIDNIQLGCSGTPTLSAPASIAASAPLNGGDTTLLHLCNTGSCDLAWSVSFIQTTPLAQYMLPASVDQTVVDVPESKGSADHHFGRDQLDSHGGPDSFGYRWADSNEATGGPTYNWVEIAGVGTALTYTTNDDDLSTPVTLPWAFNFYGTAYTTMNVSANGFLNFGAASTAYLNSAIPSASAPGAMIAPFWDDLSPQNSGAHVYTYNDAANSRYIVQFDSVPHYNSTARYTFEAILYSNGRIVLQYQRLTGTLTSCTVGIQNISGTVGLQVVYNAAYLANSLAIEFKATPPWLTFGGAASGSLSTGQCTDIPLYLSANTLAAGTYNGTITVLSNDAAHNPANIPVTFQVGVLPVPQQVTIYYLTSTNQLRLSWASTGAARYRIYSATTPNGPFTTAVGVTTSTNLLITRPADRVTYYVVKSSD